MQIDILRRRIAFIDVEASGLMRGSFPVEVAWSGDAGSGSVLVRPDDGWDRSRWDPVAEAMHGIRISDALRRGRPAEQAAVRVEQGLAQRIAFSDSPEHDAGWLDMLHAAAGRPRRYRVLSVGRLLSHLGHTAASAQRHFDRARETHPPKGRASAGARHLEAVFENALAEGRGR